MTYIHHINLATGHAERVARDDLPAEDRDWATSALAAAITIVEQTGSSAAREPGGYTLQPVVSGRCLLLGVFHGQRLEARIGVAAHSRCAPKTWALLCELPARELMPAIQAERPGQPWCAIHTAVQAREPERLDGIARALAWAWLDRVRDGAPA